MKKNKESKLIYAKHATKASSCKALSKQNVYQCYIKGVYKFPNMTVWTWTNEEGQKTDKRVKRRLERLGKN